jgi:hypothetical protein
MVRTTIGHCKFKLLCCRRVSSKAGCHEEITNLVLPENTGDKFIHFQNRDVLTQANSTTSTKLQKERGANQLDSWSD